MKVRLTLLSLLRSKSGPFGVTGTPFRQPRFTLLGRRSRLHAPTKGSSYMDNFRLLSFAEHAKVCLLYALEAVHSTFARVRSSAYRNSVPVQSVEQALNKSLPFSQNAVPASNSSEGTVRALSLRSLLLRKSVSER